jgi:NAD(P)H-quinone oxidoreductase subunit 5
MSAVLASVQVLLLADHWLLLIAAWAAVGVALERLLCHYDERPFARLAAHKKRLADRAADVLLLTAALLAWWETGQPTLSALGPWLAEHSPGLALQLSAVTLVLAVILRTALLPVHGWLIQVMEAPTPVSALLHAGVVNLGGVVLIRLAPLLEASTLARGLLLAFGLATTVLAALVMLTRISIKVRLAWSTVAQMGFMVLECGLGLYTMAALHLIGHSLYKAHSFLAASTVVQSTRQQQLVGAGMPALASQLVAPIFTAAVVFGLAAVTDTTWPWWWSAMLALAWAPLLWWPAASSLRAAILTRGVAGLVITAGLTLLALAAHHLPLQLRDAPAHGAGVVAVLGLGLLYAALLTLQHRPALLDSWRRWSYAGFYLDEAYTRWTLRLWPTAWVPTPTRIGFTTPAPTTTSMP